MLAPVATLVLVAVTLLGAVPVYRMVARYSPHGLGSIAMIEKLVRGLAGQGARAGVGRQKLLTSDQR